MFIAGKVEVMKMEQDGQINLSDIFRGIDKAVSGFGDSIPDMRDCQEIGEDEPDYDHSMSGRQIRELGKAEGRANVWHVRTGRRCWTPPPQPFMGKGRKCCDLPISKRCNEICLCKIYAEEGLDPEKSRKYG
jgi:hypothetical protein